MNYTTTIASVLGITAAGFISVWVCDFSKTYESQDYVRYDQEMEYDGEKGNVP